MLRNIIKLIKTILQYNTFTYLPTYTKQSGQFFWAK